jgi:gluconokinase
MREMKSIVIMGVAGCGKSSLGRQLANSTGMPLVEGDDHHSDANRSKMQQGIALTDADREGWLDSICAQLGRNPQGAVVACSALKRSYRERLRGAESGLRFVFLDISQTEAQARVIARAHSHFFSTTLVDNQFATLESPAGEPGVLVLDATQAPDKLQMAVCDWLGIRKEAV